MLHVQHDARAFVSELNRRGVQYSVLCAAVGELEQNFTSWRTGLNRPSVGNRVVERINRPLQQLLLTEWEEGDGELGLSDVDDEEEVEDEDDILAEFTGSVEAWKTSTSFSKWNHRPAGGVGKEQNHPGAGLRSGVGLNYHPEAATGEQPTITVTPPSDLATTKPEVTSLTAKPEVNSPTSESKHHRGTAEEQPRTTKQPEMNNWQGAGVAVKDQATKNPPEVTSEIGDGRIENTTRATGADINGEDLTTATHMSTTTTDQPHNDHLTATKPEVVNGHVTGSKPEMETIIGDEVDAGRSSECEVVCREKNNNHQSPCT